VISFDVSFRLRLSSEPTEQLKGDNVMSDEWIAKIVERLKESDKDKQQQQSYLLHRESQIGLHQDKLFADLQAVLKETIAKLNERFTETQRRFEIKSRHDRIEINGPNEFQFRIEPDFEKHELSLRIWCGEERDPRFDSTVSVDLNANGEVRYVDQGQSVSARQLSESILEILINHSL